MQYCGISFSKVFPLDISLQSSFIFGTSVILVSAAALALTLCYYYAGNQLSRKLRSHKNLASYVPTSTWVAGYELVMVLTKEGRERGERAPNFKQGEGVLILLKRVFPFFYSMTQANYRDRYQRAGPCVLQYTQRCERELGHAMS